MSVSQTGVIRMLVVEDNPADVVFLEEAIEASHTPAQLQVFGDGGEAMKFLRRQGPHANAPRPDLVVLDLNLPIMSGAEVLGQMAADSELRTIPVAILTTSTSETGVCSIYTPGRCRYFVKTADFDEFQKIVRELAIHAGCA